MPKLAIYIPKKDMREIEKWRTKINFSRVFMRALSREIAELSRKVDAAEDDLDSAAAYYKEKLSETAGPLVDLGFKIGCGHVVGCRLAPEQICQITATVDSASLSAEQTGVILTAIGEDVKSIDEFARQHGFDQLGESAWRAAALRGYAKGVADAWQRVCDKMKDN